MVFNGITVMYFRALTLRELTLSPCNWQNWDSQLKPKQTLLIFINKGPAADIMFYRLYMTVLHLLNIFSHQTFFTCVLELMENYSELKLSHLCYYIKMHILTGT